MTRWRCGVGRTGCGIARTTCEEGQTGCECSERMRDENEVRSHADGVRDCSIPVRDSHGRNSARSERISAESVRVRAASVRVRIGSAHVRVRSERVRAGSGHIRVGSAPVSVGREHVQTSPRHVSAMAGRIAVATRPMRHSTERVAITSNARQEHQTVVIDQRERNAGGAASPTSRTGARKRLFLALCSSKTPEFSEVSGLKGLVVQTKAIPSQDFPVILRHHHVPSLFDATQRWQRAPLLEHRRKSPLRC